MLGGWYSCWGAQSMSTKLLCWPLSCMARSHMDHLSSSYARHRALPLPSALPTCYPKHPLEWFRHQHWGSWNGYGYQHRGHAPQNTASLGRTCLQDGRPSPTKDRTIIFMENYPLAIVTMGHLRKYTKSIAWTGVARVQFTRPRLRLKTHE